MKTYRMNIDKVFLDNIKAGDKIHEYRLANDKRRSIKVGDLINLTLRDMTDFVLVKVKAINIYPSWKEAFNNTKDFLNDFKGVCRDLESTIERCSKFYQESDVSEFGIIVFDIEKI